MDRLALRVAFALALVLGAAARGDAQTLATLHVRAFTMSADRTNLRVGDTLHLTISARIDERVLELDNVTLPELSGFDVLGDERRCTALERSSECVELLTLQPTVAGDRTLAPTTMDAVDGRSGKPSQFATNAIVLHVAGAPAPVVPAWLPDALSATARPALSLALVGIAAWALLWAYGRAPRAPRIAAPLEVAAAVPAPAFDLDARLRGLVAALAAEPTRERALAVRAALRVRMGARDAETLADLATRGEGAQWQRALAALRAIERASFCAEPHVARAVEEAMPSLQF